MFVTCKFGTLTRLKIARPDGGMWYWSNNKTRLLYVFCLRVINTRMICKHPTEPSWVLWARRPLWRCGSTISDHACTTSVQLRNLDTFR